MVKYPKEVLAFSKGKQEARVLVERGSYVRYTYCDPETGQLIKQGKESVFLKSPKGIEHFFIIPAGSKFLLIKEKENQASIKARKIWDPKQKKAVELF